MERLWNCKKAKIALLLTLTILYFAGIIALFFNTALGVLLWAAALIPSLMLYFWLTHRQQLERERKLEEAKEKEKEKDAE